jgi:hypothetical protein
LTLWGNEVSSPGFYVLGDAFAVFQRAVLAPDLAGLARLAAVGIEVALRDGEQKSIDVAGHTKPPPVPGWLRVLRLTDRRADRARSGLEVVPWSNGSGL